MNNYEELVAAWPADWPQPEQRHPGEYTAELLSVGNISVSVCIKAPANQRRWHGFIPGPIGAHTRNLAAELIWVLQRDIATLAAQLSVLSGPDLRLVSPPAEGTASPWWFVWTPQFRHGPFSCVRGPFFSRESADQYLHLARHRHGAKAYVWCAAGVNSIAYAHAARVAARLVREVEP